VFATPLFGGQVSASLLMAYGNNDTSLNATTTGTLGPIPFTNSIALQQDTMGFGDLIPQFAERWNAGVNNYMVYLTGDIPVGRYSSSNLANMGIATARWTAALVTPISTRRPAMNFQPWLD
jgi:hypothetical protein